MRNIVCSAFFRMNRREHLSIWSWRGSLVCDKALFAASADFGGSCVTVATATSFKLVGPLPGQWQSTSLIDCDLATPLFEVCPSFFEHLVEGPLTKLQIKTCFTVPYAHSILAQWYIRS